MQPSDKKSFMITNVFSTPRTGSTWYSLFLKDLLLKEKAHKVSFLSEPFNQYHYGLYHEQTESSFINHQEYQPGCFYKKLVLKDGLVVTEKIYEKKSQTMEEEFKDKRELIQKAEGDLIVHNHVAPLSEDIFNFLLGIGQKNYMLCRKDIKQQLASYAIAYHTKRFVDFKQPEKSLNFENSIIQTQPLKDLLSRIKKQKQIIDKFPGTFDVVYYEDIQFTEYLESPKKQNLDAWKSLCTSDQEVIAQLIKEIL